MYNEITRFRNANENNNNNKNSEKTENENRKKITGSVHTRTRSAVLLFASSGERGVVAARARARVESVTGRTVGSWSWPARFAANAINQLMIFVNIIYILSLFTDVRILQ